MTTRSLAALVLGLSAAVWAVAEPCRDRWDLTFGWRHLTGSGNALAPVQWGETRQVMVLGRFEEAIGVEGAPSPSGAVMWDGVLPSNPLPADYAGPIPTEIWCAATAPEELGGELYAAGLFRWTPNDPAAEPRVALFRDSAWEIIASPTQGRVREMLFHDDGDGPELYIGGEFLYVNGWPAPWLAKRSGSTWKKVGAGVSGPVLALHSLATGGEPALLVGGDFVQAGGTSVLRIAMWDGASWSPLGAGFNGAVHEIAVDFKSGEHVIYAGGEFTRTGEDLAVGVARWDGVQWAPVGNAASTTRVEAITFWRRDDAEAEMYAGGRIPIDGVNYGLARLVDGDWVGVENIWSNVHDLGVYSLSGASEPLLVVAGSNCLGRNVFAAFDGADVLTFCNGADPTIHDGGRGLIAHDDGAGEKLYMLGESGFIGGVGSPGLTRWNGRSWEISNGWDWGNTWDATTITFDGRPALAIVGEDIFVEGSRVGAFVVWDGASLHTPQGGIPGLNARGRAIVEFVEAGVPWIVVCGNFEISAGTPATFIAAWNGEEWRSLDAGLTADATPYALAVFDDGSGPALYAAGRRMVGGSTLARWDGSAWAPVVGAPMSWTIRSMAVGDLGEGPRLHVSGDFVYGFPGSMGAWSILSWDGATWRPVGQPLRNPGIGSAAVHKIQIEDVQGVPTLLAGGRFTASGPVPLRHVARWSEGRWRPLGRGIESISALDPVRGFAVQEDGNTTSIFVCGAFDGDLYNGMSDVGRFVICAPAPLTTLADVNTDGVVDLVDVEQVARAIGDRRSESRNMLDINGDGAVDAADIEAVLGAIGETP